MKYTQEDLFAVNSDPVDKVVQLIDELEALKMKYEEAISKLPKAKPKKKKNALRKLMELAHISTELLAEKLEFSTSTVNKRLAHPDRFKISELKLIAEISGYDVFTLYEAIEEVLYERVS